MAPVPGPNWKPWAEKPNWWNTPSDVQARSATGMSSGMRASMPAQAARWWPRCIAGKSSHTVRALSRAGPVDHRAVLVAIGHREMAAADHHGALSSCLKGACGAQDHHRSMKAGSRWSP